MAKSKGKSKKDTAPKRPEKKSFNISERTQDLIFIGIIFIILLIIFKPMVIDKLSPQGVDVLSSIGAHHLMNQYSKETGERSLWNPAIFAGMPRYHRYGPIAFSVDNILRWLGRYTNNVFIYFLFGALGIYFLFRFLKISPVLSFFGAMAFVLMPHYKSLYLTGHFSKLRALMILPWVVLSFKYFVHKRSILSAALFALSFGLQIRTQHYQIVFYTGLFIFAIGIYPILRDLIEKQYLKFTKSTFLIIIGVTLAILMAAQPLFLSKEYLPYSKRGKTTIDINKDIDEQKAERSDGVSMEYATQWSTHPSEIFTWLIPRFYGGTSNEMYKGDLVPQARNKSIQVSTYWGHMPFTQSYEYMGVVILIFAVLGIYANRKDKFVISLLIFAVFLTLLSFGRHFSIFYSLFYDYVPFFNKFRAPMMSVTITFFIIVMFAILGFRYIKNINRDEISNQKLKPVLIILGSFFVLGIILLIYAQTASFIKPSGERYQGEVLELIQSIRKSFFSTDVMRYLLFVIITSGAVIGYLKKKIVTPVFIGAIGILIVMDFLLVSQRIPEDYSDRDKLENRYFRETTIDKILFNDEEMFRIFPIGKELSGYNRWAYYHQTINGYTPIKMYTIEELVENNIFNGWDQSLPINWNVLKILNVKYLVVPQQMQSEYLEQVHADKNAKLWLYLFKEYLPRAYFVGAYQIITDEYERLRTINSREFDPQQIAILEEEPDQTFEKPDSSEINMLSFTPNKITYTAYTDKQSMLKISEVHYPPGWNIFLDNKQIDKIYRTDHAIQSVIVPKGNHTIEMRFEPESYYKNIKLAYASLGVLYLVIIISLGSTFVRKINE